MDKIIAQYKQMIEDAANRSNPEFDPRKTGLLVIDMVNDGSDKNGFFKKEMGFDISLIENISPKVVLLIEASKNAGIPVIGVQTIYDFEYISDPMRESFQAMGIEGGLSRKGSWGADILPFIKNWGLDLILVKSHYSAFAPGKTFGFVPGNSQLEKYMSLPASEDVELDKKNKETMPHYFIEAQLIKKNKAVVSLDGYLRAKGIDTLIATGASTHVCVNSTIAGASERGYKVFEPIDAIAAEGVPNEGFLKHFIYAHNDGMFKAELTTTDKLLKVLRNS